MATGFRFCVDTDTMAASLLVTSQSNTLLKQREKPVSNCIVAPQPLAVEAGAAVLQNGGNAIDAAVTAALVQGVVDPQMCGLGGYAILNMHISGEPGSVGLDAPALAGPRQRQTCGWTMSSGRTPTAGDTSSKIR